MKKLWTLGIAFVFLLGLTVSAQAGSVTITFDEEGIAIGNLITTQYQDLGVTWLSSGNEVTIGSAFSNPFDSDGQIVHYTSNAGLIQTASLAKTLSFQFRRPDVTASIYLKLYDASAGGDPLLVRDFGRIGWDAGTGWVTQTYDGSSGNFDRIEISSTKKFVMDNLIIDMIGACCFADETCTEGTEGECTTAGGTYQGNGTDCLSADCSIPNEPPVADAGLDKFAINGTVTLDGIKSNDPDGEIASYAWHIQNRFFTIDAKDAEGVAPTVTELNKGIYDVTLTVTDDEGLTGTDTMMVTSCFISTLR